MSKENIFITVIDRRNHNHILEVPLGIPLSVMEVCKSYDLPVEGTCGGLALCASCHVYVESKNELSELSEDELSMLDQVFTTQSNSRLGCQIKISENIDGLIVRLAPEQV